MSRRTARDYAYKLVFESLFNKSEEESPSMQSMLADSEINDQDRQYMKSVADGVKEHYDELCELIVRNSKNFRIERIFKPDLAALLLAAYEMKYMKDIPCAVSINEVIELDRKYSMPDSFVFVNGVLAGIYKELEGDK